LIIPDYKKLPLLFIIFPHSFLLPPLQQVVKPVVKRYFGDPDCPSKTDYLKIRLLAKLVCLAFADLQNIRNLKNGIGFLIFDFLAVTVPSFRDFVSIDCHRTPFLVQSAKNPANSSLLKAIIQ
jgi:hypothetical protein